MVGVCIGCIFKTPGGANRCGEVLPEVSACGSRYAKWQSSSGVKVLQRAVERRRINGCGMCGQSPLKAVIDASGIVLTPPIKKFHLFLLLKQH